MLAYILALVVGLGSFGIYMAAFFFPEVHRKSDFYWSGVGLFYALVLWVCAGRITGGVLLGQTAGTALLGWFGWQTFKLRRELTPLDQQTALPQGKNLQEKLANLPLPGSLSKLPEQATNLFNSAKDRVQTATQGQSQPATSTTTLRSPATPPTKSAEPAIAREEPVAPVVTAPETSAGEATTPEISPETSLESLPETPVEEAVVSSETTSIKEVVAESLPVEKESETKAVDTTTTVVSSGTTRSKTSLAQEKLQEKLTNLPIRQNLSRATGLFNNAKDQVQGLVGRFNKGKKQPDTLTPPPPRPTPTAAPLTSNSDDSDFDETEDALEAPTGETVKAIAVESVLVEEPTDIEEPAEEPTTLIVDTGVAAPKASPEPEQSELDSTSAEALPVVESTKPADAVIEEEIEYEEKQPPEDANPAVPSAETVTSDDSASTPPEALASEPEETEDPPGLIRPKPPSPELVEAARRAAEAKAQEHEANNLPKPSEIKPENQE